MFFNRYDVSHKTQVWLVESFDWAIENGILTRDTPLILPTKSYFTAPSGSSPEVVLAVFSDLKRLLNIADRQIELLPMEVLPLEYRRRDYRKLSEAGGTWQSDGTHSLIRYDPERAKRPISFIATLAHELMHDILHRIDEYPPGGAEAEELSTDLHCITAGFGVFQMAGAEDSGWQGYMRQSTRGHALALFLAIRQFPATEALAHLPPRAQSTLKRAAKEVVKDSESIERLKLRLRTVASI